MTEPRTTKGLALRGALRRPRTMPDDEVDWGAWIAGIEDEAAAPAPAGLREAAEVVIDAYDNQPFQDGLEYAMKRLRAAAGDVREPLCGVVSNSGPNSEPLACPYPRAHEGRHAWATLPTWTPETFARFLPYWRDGNEETCLADAVAILARLAGTTGETP